MKVSILQESFFPGAWEENYKKISTFYKKACREKSDLAIVPGDALCGFDPLSLLDYSVCSDKISRLQKKLVQETNTATALVFDSPFALDGSFMPSLMLAVGGCIRFSAKQHPEADADMQADIFEYEGKRIYFSYLSDWTLVTVGTQDDIPADMAVLLDARLFKSGNETLLRHRMLDCLAKVFDEVVYVDQCGGQATAVLTGASAFFSSGDCRLQLPYFEPAACTFDTQDKPKGKVVRMPEEGQIALIHDAIVCCIRDYFRQNGIKKAVLGLSGGIDSAVVLPLAVEALGRKNVFGLMMPSQFSTGHSVEDAVKEAENLQIYYEIIPIKPVYDVFMKQLAPVFKDTPFGLAEENLQARIRGNLLMATANKTGAMLLNTSNKSESACGYGTMYGDLCGGMSVIGDLYKSQVYELARYINRKKEIIPQNCIDKAPSAELHPGQQDSDSLPPYDLIEKVLRMHLEEMKDEKEIVRSGVPKEVTVRVLDLFNKSAYKRRQAPPAIRLSETLLAVDVNIPPAYKKSR